MNFGEAPIYESGSLEESLAEVGLPTDPRRLVDRLYKFTFTTNRTGINSKGIFIGTIVGLRFGKPHEVWLIVSDPGVVEIYSYIMLSGPKWRLQETNGETWEGDLKLL